MGLRFEDLSGIRQTSKQSKKVKSDAGNNRDGWSFYQLEQFTCYKAVRAGVPVEFVPAPYTSKSDHRYGVIGQRNGNWFKGFDEYHCDADWNASRVLTLRKKTEKIILQYLCQIKALVKKTV